MGKAKRRRSEASAGSRAPSPPSPPGGTAGQDFRRRFLDWLTTSGPGVVIIVGMMLMAINDPWAPHIVGAGVAIQVAFLVWRLVSLRGRGEPRGQVKR